MKSPVAFEREGEMTRKRPDWLKAIPIPMENENEEKEKKRCISLSREEGQSGSHSKESRREKRKDKTMRKTERKASLCKKRWKGNPL